MSYVRIDPTKLNHLFRSPVGPVQRYQVIIASALQAEAKRRVGVSIETGVGPQPHLRDSIVKRPTEGGAVTVGSDLPHALLHHEGTPPHEIVPNKAKVLRFPVGGVIVFAQRVMHPGTKPNRYLEDAAEALGLRFVRKGDL